MRGLLLNLQQIGDAGLHPESHFILGNPRIDLGITRKTEMLAIQLGEVIQRGDIHLGVAVETDGGLVVPVIRNADQLSTGGLAKAVVDVADKARDKKITLDDLSGGTFTVSNPGRRGNLFGAAIINQPQVGILRMGEIVRRPVVRTIAGEEVICIRSMMYLSLSYDHRIIDGVQGNGFLFRIRELLEAGQFDI